MLGAQARAQLSEPDDVIVTGSRMRLDARQLGSAVTVVTRAEIEAGQTLLAKDILQDVPGVQISNDRPGAVTSIYLRGADNDQVLVLLDGLELGDPSNISTQFQFDHLNAGDIERIEVLRGNQSSLYGSDAIGGVINVITRQPAADGTHFSMDAEAGSYGLERLDASVTGNSGKFDYRFGANTFSADGPSRADPTAGPADEKDAYDRVGISARFGVQFTPGWRLELRGFASDTETELDGTGQDATFAPLIEKDDTATAVTLARDDLAGRWHHELSFSQFEAERVYPDSRDRFNGDKNNLRFSSSFSASNRVSLAFGFDLEEENTDQWTGFSGSFLAATDTNSLFAEAALAPSSDFTLTLAVRQDDNERFGTFVTHRVTAAYSLGVAGPETKLRASYGTGAKAPGLYQLFDPTFGNAELKVEESAGYDLGLDLVWPGGEILAVSYFSNDIENEIDFQWPAGYLNLGATRAQGIETQFSAPVSERLDWSLSYTYLESHNAATQTWLGRPRNTAMARLNVAATERLSLTARARYRSRNAASFGGITGSFVTVDLLSSYDISERLEFFARIVNLFDRDYQYEWGSSTYDRSAFAGVRMRY